MSESYISFVDKLCIWHTNNRYFYCGNKSFEILSEILTALKKIDGVQAVHIVYGVYNIVAKIGAESNR